MDIEKPLALLGHMSPQAFMKRHWQKKPLLVRNAVSDFAFAPPLPPLSRTDLFELAARDSVESRLVVQRPGKSAKKPWKMEQGPFQRRRLPPLQQAGWTLLVQGLDLHHSGMRALLDQFRFVPDARLDDVMVSYATPEGGVGPHFDSYDVFLLQTHGHRRWRISRQKDLTLVAGAPLKILENFVSEQEYDLAPGDMLYLPPRWAHDGVALDECMTCSIGFRAPARVELAQELLLRLADDVPHELAQSLYADPKQLALGGPGEIPPEMVEFARDAVKNALHDTALLPRLLGEYLTEPKSSVWFEAESGGDEGPGKHAIALDRRSKMMFDQQHIFINGESFLASGQDAALMQALANDRRLALSRLRSASKAALALLGDWLQAGWIVEEET